jgi:CobQ-like glutamine amidotransferase family enzyme
MKYDISIAWLYPDLMSTYGDRGNVIVLEKRSIWRDIRTTIVPITLETTAGRLNECDLIFMGGAQDRQQQLAAEDFLGNKGPIVKAMVERGTPALFVCAAYQFAGCYYRPYEGHDIPGVAIFDLVTIHPGDQAKRLIGNVTAEIIGIDISGCPSKDSGRLSKTMIGFENHGGRTRLGPDVLPLARVTRGFGNNGEDGYEGAVYKNAIGSYFHGPLLPKNPIIADWLIAKALEKKYQIKESLSALDDRLETAARQQLIH